MTLGYKKLFRIMVLATCCYNVYGVSLMMSHLYRIPCRKANLQGSKNRIFSTACPTVLHSISGFWFEFYVVNTVADAGFIEGGSVIV